MFDQSCILIFRAVTDGVVDTTALYAMIDERLVNEAKEGLTTTQIATVESYRYVPTEDDYALRGFPVWAGNDPVSVYFKATGKLADQESKLRSALAKRWRE